MKRHQWDYIAATLFTASCGISFATGYGNQNLAGLLEEKAKLAIELNDTGSAEDALSRADSYRVQGAFSYTAAALFGIAGALSYSSGRSSAKREEKK